MRPNQRLLTTLAFFALPTASAHAQIAFGSGCPGASGVTPELVMTGVVRSGSPWTLEVTAPGGIGFGYLLIGFSNTSTSVVGTPPLPLPIDLGALFSDPLWGGCMLNVDPSYLFLPYTFDPNANGGTWSMDFQGFDSGELFVQALNLDPDFTTRIAGLSEGLLVLSADRLIDGMVPIKPGTFTMGSSASSGLPYLRDDDENPHAVTISRGFWMGRREVTQQEYAAVMGLNTSIWQGMDRPVENLTWGQALDYCHVLTAIESAAGNVPDGYEYRLPTEAEWEYACRAGSTTEFNVGNVLVCSDAHFFHSYHSGSDCNNGSGTADVESYAPNAWGLFDMHGNVLEWCLDSYTADLTGPVTDPFVTGDSYRVVRGGGWGNTSSLCRSAARLPASEIDSYTDVGFRVVLAPDLAP